MRNFDEFRASLLDTPHLTPVTVERLDGLPAELLDRPTAAADHGLARFGFTGIGETWRRLDRTQAEAELAWHLGTSLAYGVEMLPPAAATAAAAEFLAYFPAPEAVFLTNASPPRKNGFGWNPVSASTFDICIVVVSGDSAAFILLEDED